MAISFCEVIGAAMSVRNMKSVFMPEDDKYLDANEYLDHCDDDDFFNSVDE